MIPQMHYDGQLPPPRPKPPEIVRINTGPPVALIVLIFAVAVILHLLVAALAKADTVVAFSATWCGPCQSMKPIEQQLIAEHYDIRPVDIDKDKARAKAYRVGPIPCFVAVKEVSPGVWKETGRIVGKCTAGQLRRLAVIPKVTTIGAASRNAVRALFTPCPILEW